MSRALLGSALAAILLLLGCGSSSNSHSLPAVTLVSIQVSGASTNLTVGQSQSMTAMGTYSDGSKKDLTTSVTWASTNSAVATITTSGVVTADAAGNCSVSAKSGAIGGSFSLTVAPGLVSIAVTPAAPSIAANTTVQFTATGTYSDGSTQNLTSAVTWASSNTLVATVSDTSPTKGFARALAAGTASITATSGTVSGAASMTVTAAYATSIVITPSSATLALGLSQQFTANATFSDGTTQDVTGVATWASSATSVVSITTSGLATAKNVGNATISASFESVSANVAVTVNAANLVSIAIQPANATMAPGTTLQFQAVGTFNDGGTRDITHLASWTSSVQSIAAIGPKNGYTFGVAPGTVTITASLGSATDSTSLTVSSAKIVSISVTPISPTIPIGGHVRFTATGLFDDSSTEDLTAAATWTSGNTAVATVSNISGSFGTATGVSSGSTSISANFSYSGASATGSASLTVDSATLASISVSPASALVAPGTNVQFTVTGIFSDGTKQTLTGLATWTSSDTTIATVGGSGLATGQSAGVVTITAQIGPLSSTASLVVESSTLVSIQITPTSAQIPVGVRTSFAAIGTFSNGNTLDLTSAAVWTSASSSIATISNISGSYGQATGVQPGNTQITAAFGGQVGTATLTVTNATLNSISVTPTSASISVGATQQFAALGTFSDGSNINLTFQAKWSSSSPNIATVNSVGLATAVSSGSATIQATLNGVNGSATLTVQ